MGKASRWFRNLLGLKKQPSPPPHSATKPTKKNRWGFSNSSKITLPPPPEQGGDNHPISEAEVVRRRGGGGRVNFSVDQAAVVIQAHFRGYLARRALRALKSLVKLQALVRGHTIRKQTTDILRRMQALSRAQARARAGRTQLSESPSSSAKSSQFHHPDPATPEKFEHVIRSNSARRDLSPILKRNGSKSTSRLINDSHSPNFGYVENEKTDKIVEIDNFKPHLIPKRKNLFHSTHLSLSSDQYSHSFSTSKDSTAHQTLPSLSPYEVRSFSPLKKVTQDLDESPFCTALNSPQNFSASSRCGSTLKSPFTPSKSDCTKSYLSGYSDYPNYMSYTESSKAKIRSLSAPKQRPPIEKSGSIKRALVYNFGESKISAQRASAMHASFVSKAYPGSGRLDRLGLPMNNVGYLYRY